MIRIPFTQMHAPWTVLLSAAVVTVLMLAASGAWLVLSLSWSARVWSRLRRDIAVAVTFAAALVLGVRTITRQMAASRRRKAQEARKRPVTPGSRVPLPSPDVLHDGPALTFAEEQTWAVLTGQRGDL